MELRHLRYFVAVAEEENVTRAAARLHVAQPAVSRQIRDLEDELRVMLFQRSAKSVKLTEAGRVFLEEARAVLQRTEAAVNAVRSVSDGARGELNVGYAPSLTVQILPRALRRFQDAWPGVRVALHDLSTEEMLAGLKEERLHVALMVRPEEKALLRGLRFHELAQYSLSLAMAPGHQLAGQKSVTLAKIAGYPLIGYSRAGYPEYHEGLVELFRPLGRTPAVVEEHDSVTSLIAAVESGHGVAIVASGFACLAGFRLKVLPIAAKAAPIIVGAVCRKGNDFLPAERFIEAASGDEKDDRLVHGKWSENGGTEPARG